MVTKVYAEAAVTATNCAPAVKTVAFNVVRSLVGGQGTHIPEDVREMVCHLFGEPLSMWNTRESMYRAMHENQDPKKNGGAASGRKQRIDVGRELVAAHEHHTLETSAPIAKALKDTRVAQDRFVAMVMKQTTKTETRKRRKFTDTDVNDYLVGDRVRQHVGRKTAFRGKRRSTDAA